MSAASDILDDRKSRLGFSVSSSPHIDRDPCVLEAVRTSRGYAGSPDAGASGGGAGRLVVNLMGRLFMDALDDPFARLDGILCGIDPREDVARKSS